MSYSFGERSQKNLDTCHEHLIMVANEAIRFVDFSVIEGNRSIERQHELFLDGKSEIDGIEKMGMHNHNPSLAFDLLPYPASLHGINVWADTFRFTLFAGYILGIGQSLGIDLRWGGDWNSDWSCADQNFNDLPHFELRGML